MNLLNRYSLCVSEIDIIKKQLVDLILHDENKENEIVKPIEGCKFLKTVQFSDLNNTWDFRNEITIDKNYKGDIEHSIMNSRDVVNTLSNMVNNCNVTNKNGKSLTYFTKLKPETVVVIKNILGEKILPKKEGKGRDISSKYFK